MILTVGLIYIDISFCVGKTMQRLLALSLLFGSTATYATTPPVPYDSLSIEQVENPDYVSAWLKRKDLKINHKSIDYLNQEAEKHIKNKYWEPAVKAYGGAILYYPSAEAILKYIDVSVQMLKRIRKRDGDLEQKKWSDMAFFLKYYKSAAAANAVLKTLPETQQVQLKTNVECLEKYITTKQFQPGCGVLTDYGIAQ